MEIFKLFGSIFIDNEKANQAIDNTDKKGKGVAGTLGGMIGTAAKWGAGLYAGAATALGGMVALVNRTAAAADEIDKLSERTGINREELQRWKYAAGQSGANIEKLEVGMKTLSDQMDRASSGNKTAVSSFERLGISIDDLRNKSQSEIFDQVMKGLADMEQGAARNALGNDVLGRSYTELLPLLNAGSEGMDKLKQRANELGLVLSEEGVKANVVFGDTWSDLKQAMGAAFAQIGTAMIPILQTFIDLVLANMPAIRAIFSTVFGVISTLINGFVQSISWVIDTVKGWLSSNQETLQQMQTGFQEFVQLVTDIFTALFANLKAFWETHGEAIMAVLRPLWEGIKTIVETAIGLVRGILQTVLGLITGDWGKAWEGVKGIFSSVWEGMKNLLPNLLEGIYKAIRASFSILFDLGKKMFGQIWEGIKSIWSGIAGWISDKVSWLTDKLFFWRKGQSEMSETKSTPSASTAVDGSHATGLGYVPYDGYIAELHRGEEVVPAGQRSGNFIIQNDFRGMLDGMVAHIREEADIDRLAEKLSRMVHLQQQGQLRAQGRV